MRPSETRSFDTSSTCFLLRGRFDDLNPAFVQRLVDRLNGADLHSTLMREHTVAG